MCYDSGRLSFWQVRLQVWISPWVVGGMNTRIENNKKSSIQILSNLCIVSAYYLFIVSAYVCLHCLYIIHVCIIVYTWIQNTSALLSIRKYVCSLGIYMSWPWRYRKSHVRTNSLNDETNYKMNLKQAEHSKWKSLSDYSIFIATWDCCSHEVSSLWDHTEITTAGFIMPRIVEQEERGSYQLARWITQCK